MTLEAIADGYGDNTIAFKPIGFSYEKLASDTPDTITVAGLTGSGVPSSSESDDF